MKRPKEVGILVEAFQRGDGVTLGVAECRKVACWLLGIEERVDMSLKILANIYPDCERLRGVLNGED
jgi:hypothetical protein